jgi:UDP-3-O-[3-hydroxymyristoyl] glucosamine N-acyltransferase
MVYSTKMKLQDLAVRLGCQLEGDGSLDVVRVTTLEAAGPGDVTFLANRKYASQVAATRATAVIADDTVTSAPCAILRTKEPYLAFTAAVAIFAPDDRPAPGVSDLAFVAPDAELGADVHVGAFAWIGPGVRVGARTIIHPHAALGAGVSVGDDCVLHSHVSVRERCQLGHRVILQNGAVIGSEGFGYAPRPDGTFQRIPQVAIVVLEDDVEVGANSTIDRPAVGETRIGAGTKIDNLVQLAHGVRTGRNVILAAQVGVSGSVTIDDNAMLGGQVGVAGHLRIGKGTRVTAQTGIHNSLPDGSFVSGYPAIENRDWLKSSAVFRRLPELKRAIAELERRVAELESSPTAPQERPAK